MCFRTAGLLRRNWCQRLAGRRLGRNRFRTLRRGRFGSGAPVPAPRAAARCCQGLGAGAGVVRVAVTAHRLGRRRSRLLNRRLRSAGSAGSTGVSWRQAVQCLAQGVRLPAAATASASRHRLREFRRLRPASPRPVTRRRALRRRRSRIGRAGSRQLAVDQRDHPAGANPKVGRRLRVLLDLREEVARLLPDRRPGRPPCPSPRAPHAARRCR